MKLHIEVHRASVMTLMSSWRVLKISEGTFLKTEILCHLFRFICTFLTKAACCRNIEIVLHPTILSHI